MDKYLSYVIIVGILVIGAVFIFNPLSNGSGDDTTQASEDTTNQVIADAGGAGIGRASVSDPFYINAWVVIANTGGSATDVGENGGVVVELLNNGGRPLEIQSVKVSGCGNNDVVNKTVLGGLLEIVTINCEDGTELIQGKTFGGVLTVIYREVGSTVDLTSTGEIVGKIVP